jgi:predicted AAA+ superfamily ATPase
MPGIHAISPDDAPVFEYLRAIADTVILKDVVARHQVRNVRLLENILRFVLDTSGSPVSAKRIAD